MPYRICARVADNPILNAGLPVNNVNYQNYRYKSLLCQCKSRLSLTLSMRILEISVNNTPKIT